MRPGLDAPTETFPSQGLGPMRDFLDRQRPIDLAVWVRHEQQGAGGPLYDHHTVLGIDDERYAVADLPALERGVELECPGIAGWLDLFPISEVQELRGFGEVLWARSGNAGDLDPLDFRFTREPIEVTPEARSVFVELVQEVAPAVVRIHAHHSRLWKGEQEVEGATYLYVGWDESRRGAPNTLRLVCDAAREAGIESSGGTLGVPVQPPSDATVLYDKTADG